MLPDKMVSQIEKGSNIVVIEVFDCGDNYVAECLNSVTKSLIGDFYYISSKNEDSLRCLNPAVDPEAFVSMMKNKKSVYQNNELIEQMLKFRWK